MPKTFFRKMYAFLLEHQAVALFAGFTLIVFAMNLLVNFDLNDDAWFREMAAEHGPFAYLKHRYQTWSGRSIAEWLPYFFCSHTIWIWRILNALMFSTFIFQLARFFKDTSKETQLFTRSILFAGLGFFGLYVIESCFFWVTGSTYYLWAGTAALYTIYPFWRAVRDLPKKNAFQPTPLYFLALVFACLAQEQIALLLIGFGAVFMLYLHYNKRNIPRTFFLSLGLMLATLIFSLTAPGNQVRLHHEIARFYPQYLDLGFSHKLFLTIQWLLNGLVNENKMLIIALWAVLTQRLFKLKKYSLGRVLLLYIVLALGSLGQIWPQLFAFGIEEDFALKLAYLPLLCWWILAIIVTGAAIYISWPKDKLKGIFLTLLYAAGLCASSIMFFSPTIYASGARTFFAMSVLFLFIIVNYLREFKNKWPVYALFALVLLGQFMTGLSRL